jgi:hypothetical protein
MQRCNAILLLGLLLWVDPASAQKLKIHSLRVSIHEEVRPSPTQSEIEQILKDASDLLQEPPNRCGVGFKLKGPVTTFTSAPAFINDASDLEAVHSVPADVKVVREINFCIRGPENGLVGCSWRPNNRPKTVIVTRRLKGVGLSPVLWTHEFGHVTGLQHRNDEDEEALMTPCGLQAFNRRINKDECRHFLAGPVQHYPPGLGPACPKPSSRYRTD